MCHSVTTAISSNTGKLLPLPSSNVEFHMCLKFNLRGNCFDMQCLNQHFQIKYDLAGSATELQLKIRFRFNI